MRKTHCLMALLVSIPFLATAQLTSIVPNSGVNNQTLQTVITGSGIFIQASSPGGNLYEVKLIQGGNTIMIFDFWNSWNYNVTVTSTNTVDAEVIIPLAAPSGAYDLQVITGDVLQPWINQNTYTLPAAFTVTPPDGYIMGTVYHDLNKNGIKDGGEPGIANRQVKLMPNNYTLNSDANGDYSFPVANGNYSVILLNNTNPFMFVTASDTLSMTVSSGNSTGNDFGLKHTMTSITPDIGYQGSPTLHTLVADEPIFTTGGNPYGNVGQIYIYSTPNINVNPIGAVTVIDSVTIQAIINVPIGTLAADSIDIRVYVTGTYGGYHFLYDKFTVAPPDGIISGKVFNDLNNNSIQDGGETTYQSYPVKLLPANLSIVTDVSGNYSFGVMNGNYSVTTTPITANYLYANTGDTLSVTINSNNSTGNDFAMHGALMSVTPDIGYQGIFTTHQFVADKPIFIPGGSPSGNITQVRVFSSPSVFANVGADVTVIDSFTVQVGFNVPASTVIANNLDVSFTLNAGPVGNHYLRQQFEIAAPPVSVTGNLFFDQNQNKINDPGEPGIYGGKVKLLPDSSIAFSDFDGNFYLGSLGGPQTLTYENNIPSLVLFTDSTSYTFNATGNITGKDFGFLSTYPDYHIRVTIPSTIRRCNTQQNTSFSVQNRCNIAYDAVAWLKFDPLMTYISSLVPPSSISNDTIYWNLSNIQPYTNVYLQVLFMLPGAGNTIYLTSGASSLDAGGVVQESYSYPAYYVITCAWDPNDKQVTPPGIFAQNFTLMSDTLEYMIRFQNTGNDTAFNVVILDTLDSNLDFNTFEILGSSHSVQTELESNGAVRFAFNNIMLPDSNINEPESHGYVRYRILADAGLSDSTEVLNTAHIFFDFNPDVVTNSTLNTLVYVLPTGIGELYGNNNVILYPNPFSQSATLLFDNAASDKFTLSITAVTGNKVMADKSTTGNQFVIEKGKLQKGIYFYNLVNAASNQRYSGKFIVE